MAEVRRGRSSALPRARRSALIGGADPSIRQLLRTVLEIGGFQVAEAGSHGEVLERLAAPDHVPHLVVLDVSLPAFAGLPTLHQVRQRAHLRDLPIVVLTSFAEPPDHQQFLECGASAVLAKPFSSQRLLNLATQFAATR